MRKVLAIGSIVAVVLLILSSFPSIVGTQLLISNVEISKSNSLVEKFIEKSYNLSNLFSLIRAFIIWVGEGLLYIIILFLLWYFVGGLPPYKPFV
jgi:hypothetical protein